MFPDYGNEVEFIIEPTYQNSSRTLEVQQSNHNECMR
jgi:hypothetical protein